MKMIPITSISVLLVVSMSARAQTTQPTSRGIAGPVAQPPSPQVYVLRITCDRGLLPPGTHMPIVYLLKTGIVEEACERNLPGRQPPPWQFGSLGPWLRSLGGVAALADAIPPDESGPPSALEPKRAEFESNLGQLNVILVELTVSFGENVKPEERSAVIESIRESLQNVLREMQGAETARLVQSLKQAEQKVEEARMRLVDLQKRRAAMIRDAGYSDVSQEFVLELARNIEKERQETALKVERLRFRQQAIQKRIAEIAAEAKDPARLDNPVVQAYKGKLEALQRKLEIRKEQAKKGITATSELADAEAELAMAKAELQDRIQGILNEAGGKRLPALNEELSTTSLDLAEAQARVAALDKRSDEMKRVVVLSDEYEMQVGMLLPSARAAYDSASRRAQSLRDRFDSLQTPTVSVYGR